jgi:S-formylglutathione hydrolase FrmB
MSSRRYPVVYLLHGDTDNESAWIQCGEIFGPKLSGKDRLTAHFRNYHPLDLAKTLPETSLKKVRFYLDCGDDDFLYKGNVALRDRKIPHEFHGRDGGHTWLYWRTGIVEGLKFIGQSFHR